MTLLGWRSCSPAAVAAAAVVGQTASVPTASRRSTGAGLHVRLPGELGGARRRRGRRGRAGPEGHRRARPAGGGRARRRHAPTSSSRSTASRPTTASGAAAGRSSSDEDYKLDGAKGAHLIEADLQRGHRLERTTPVRTIDVLVQHQGRASRSTSSCAPREADFDNARLREVLDTFRLK